jgi:hypothetical protein
MFMYLVLLRCLFVTLTVAYTRLDRIGHGLPVPHPSTVPTEQLSAGEATKWIVEVFLGRGCERLVHACVSVKVAFYDTEDAFDRILLIPMSVATSDRLGSLPPP